MMPPVTPPQLFSPHPKTQTVNDQTIPMFPFKQPMPRNNFTNFAHTHSHFALDPAMPRPYPPNPTRTRETYLKAEMCRNFQAGTCFKGRNCKFAHGVEEIRRVPPKRKFSDYSHENNQVMFNDDDQTIIKKMKLCLWFCNGGKCRHGSQCRYVHENPDKFRTGLVRSRESSAIVVGAGGGSSFHNQMVPDELDINVTAKTNVSFGRRMIAIKWQMIEKQNFGRHNKVERGNTSRAPSKPLSNSGHEIRPRGTAIGVCPNQLMQRKKEMLMSKGHEKIKGIYADWVDDLV